MRVYPIYRVLAIDPGFVTGTAVVDVFNTNTVQQPPGLRRHALFGPNRGITVLGSTNIEFENAPAELKQTLEAVAGDPNIPVSIVVEKFVATTKTIAGHAEWSWEVTGMVHALAGTMYFPLKVDTKQMPSTMKTTVGRHVLKEMGLLEPKMSQHQIDALGHAVLYVARNRSEVAGILV